MKGAMKCPVCQGTGKKTEDFNEYEFITRDPITQKCLVCNGTGWVGPRKKLPDGRGVHELLSGKPAKKFQRKTHLILEPAAQPQDIKVKAKPAVSNDKPKQEQEPDKAITEQRELLVEDGHPVMATVVLHTKPPVVILLHDNKQHDNALIVGWQIESIIKAIKGE